MGQIVQHRTEAYNHSMKLKADVSVKWGDFARVEELIVPKLINAADRSTELVLGASQEKVAVDTGELKASGRRATEWKGKRVEGIVEYGAGHAAYVEFGTGARGQSSAGAGDVPYDPEWPGMPAQPYLRPSLDENAEEILGIYRDELK